MLQGLLVLLKIAPSADDVLTRLLVTQDTLHFAARNSSSPVHALHYTWRAQAVGAHLDAVRRAGNRLRARRTEICDTFTKSVVTGKDSSRVTRKGEVARHAVLKNI